MLGRKKVVQSISIFLVLLFIISTFCFSINSYAKAFGLTDSSLIIEIIEDRIAYLKSISDKVAEYKNSLSRDMAKDRDFLAYSYGKGDISLDNYNSYVRAYKTLYSIFDLEFVPVENIKVNIDDSDIETLNTHIVEIIARDTMKKMYDTMTYDVKRKNSAEIVLNDPWYLCPYNCRSSGSKVNGWGECIHKTGYKGDRARLNCFSTVEISTKKYIELGGKAVNTSPKTITIRRDCSAYIIMVLANLGCDYAWGISDYLDITTRRLCNDIEKIRASQYFDVLPYSKDTVKPGDIVLKRGHTEVFLGWDNKEENRVYHYSWGKTGSVECVLNSNEEINYLLGSEEDLNYDGKYTYIIRYIGTD